jgi:ATP-binding cassette, subfamily F, member 3
VIHLQGVRVQFGARFVLDRIDVQIGDRERLAVVGRNGEGKSTLLKVASGELVPDEGEVVRSRGQEVGMLRQENVVPAGITLWQEAFAALEPVKALEGKATAALELAAELPDDDPRHHEALHEAEELLERFRQRGGYEVEATCGRVLSGLGFAREDWERKTEDFSGGWQVRIALARLLLERPDTLLLDEPTNHLDLETRTWLLHELKAWPGGVVIISHDRDFLDRLVTRTIEVAGGALQEYRGGYSQFLRQRAERLILLRKASEERDAERTRIQLFINRFRAKASKAAQVQARVKALVKLPPIVVPQLAKPPRMSFDNAPPSADPMLDVRGLDKAYGDTSVLEGVNATVWAGRRVLLVGPNGAGKSTMLRLLASQESPDGGLIRPGAGVRTAWFAQDQARALDPDQTVLGTIQKADTLRTETQCRTFLGSFLFTGDDVHKPVGVLSGGEKSRVALALVLLKRANLLLLDEPTNHLDIETKEVLADALGRFPGAVVFVSHDRSFANALADTVWEVGKQTLVEHNGNLDDFLWQRAIDLGVAERRAPGEQAPDTWLLGGLPEANDEGGSAQTQASEGKETWAERKRLGREAQQLQRRIAKLEARIEELEVQERELSEALASPELAQDWDKLSSMTKDWERVNAELEAVMEEWAELEGG